MKACPDCIPCIMNNALEASKMATDDEKLQEKAVTEVAKGLGEVSLEGTPLSIAYRALNTVREVTGSPDPYRELKKKSNENALELYPVMKEKVENSEDSLLTATKIAIAGNIIDFGPENDFDVEETIKEKLNGGFAIDHFEELREEIEQADEIIYLSDNAGEIVFDRLLIEQLTDKDIKFFVRGFPILNDAMRKEAEFVGIDKVAEIEEMDEDIGLDEISEKFENRLEEADLVISKGQANYEAFSEIDPEMYFLLIVKCPLVSDHIGVKEGSAIVKKSNDA